MKFKMRNAFVVALALGLSQGRTLAYEFGTPGTEQKPGITINAASAAVPPPGLYLSQTAYGYQAKFVGPGTPAGNPTLRLTSTSTTLYWSPGWTFLGAQYGAFVLQPISVANIEAPINASYSGLHNPLIVPAELSWKLGDSGFYFKSALGLYTPTGTISGPAGLSNAGHPWWTFVPNVTLSYLANGWNISARFDLEMSTHNPYTGYRNGNILHSEFKAVKNIGKWRIGPVGYYYGQVSSDQSSRYYNNAINVNRYNVWALGALIGYDFGPVALTAWALQDIHADSSGSYPVAGRDAVNKGFNLFMNVSFRLPGQDDDNRSAISTKIR